MRGLLRSILAVGLGLFALALFMARTEPIVGIGPAESLRVYTFGIWICFLGGLLVAVSGSIDSGGRLRAPSGLSHLIAWLAVIPAGGMAIGSAVHYDDTLAMMLAGEAMPAARVRMTGNETGALHGSIGAATVSSLREAYRLEGLRTLLIESPGGSVEAAFEMADFIEQHEIGVQVRSFCDSACIPVALSGSPLNTAPDASFGFHRSSAVTRRDSEIGRYIGRYGTDLMLARLERRGVPAGILERAAATPPDELYEVSGRKLIDLGLAKPMKNRP